MNTETIRIISYTDKSFVVVGDTKKYKESLKNLGGKWNSSLTNKETGEKFMGWIFYSGKRKEIESWINNGCLNVDVKEEFQPTSFQRQSYEIKQECKQECKQEGKNSDDNDRIKELERKLQLVLSKVSSLENEVSSLKSKLDKGLVCEEFDVVEEVEEVKPRSRLLRR